MQLANEVSEVCQITVTPTGSFTVSFIFPNVSKALLFNAKMSHYNQNHLVFKTKLYSNLKATF